MNICNVQNEVMICDMLMYKPLHRTTGDKFIHWFVCAHEKMSPQNIWYLFLDDCTNDFFYMKHSSYVNFLCENTSLPGNSSPLASACSYFEEKHGTTDPGPPENKVFDSKRHDRPSPCSETGQDLFATDLLQVRLSAQQPREPRAEDGDQVGDVGSVRVVRVCVRTVLPFHPFASCCKIW